MSLRIVAVFHLPLALLACEPAVGDFVDPDLDPVDDRADEGWDAVASTDGDGDGSATADGDAEPGCTWPGALTPDPDAEILLTSEGELVYGWDPSVHYDANAGLWRAWYTLYNGATRTLGIAMSTSDDGLVWDRVEAPGGHVLSPTEGGWDSKGLETVSVLHHDETWYMWYLGYPCDLPEGEFGRHKCIGLATSSDGETWTKEADPVLKPELSWEAPYSKTVEEGGTTFTVWDGGVQEPTVLWDAEAELFKMWYQGNTWGSVTYEEGGVPITWTGVLNRVGYATSSDGITWDRREAPVFQEDPTASWESLNGAAHVNVVPDPVVGYHLFYHSWFSLGSAYSADGIDWERNPNNPLLPFSTSGETVVMYGGPSGQIGEENKVTMVHMRSIPGATSWGQGGMVLGLADGTCTE